MPLIDFRRESAVHFEADICIIGSGAAGLTLATRIAGPHCSVLLVESGGLEKAGDADALLRGSGDGPEFPGMIAGRARALGGTTRLWSGGCIRLDAIDFESRDWVPWSGWPFGLEQLEPFYHRAAELLRLRFEKAVQNALRRANGFAEHVTDAVLGVAVYCPQRDFSKLFRRSMSTRGLRILTHATATHIQLNRQASRVEAITLRNSAGRSASVHAAYVVLCGGGIENARLLLCSNDVVPAGVGNGNDLVGRFFQDHPGCFAGEIAADRSSDADKAFSYRLCARRLTWLRVALSANCQKQERLLNAYAYPASVYRPRSAFAGASSSFRRARPDPGFAVTPRAQRVGVPSRAVEPIKQMVRSALFERARFRIRVIVEQAPDPENRVTLGSDRDDLAMPRARVRWSVGKLERKTAQKAAQLLSSGLGASPSSGADPEPNDGDVVFEGTYHHAGTTRMSVRAAKGVVDPNLRVHGIDNLYVCGGSVMPTSGAANPTLTIVALALRLGDHLKLRVSQDATVKNFLASARTTAAARGPASADLLVR